MHWWGLPRQTKNKVIDKNPGLVFRYVIDRCMQLFPCHKPKDSPYSHIVTGHGCQRCLDRRAAVRGLLPGTRRKFLVSHPCNEYIEGKVHTRSLFQLEGGAGLKVPPSSSTTPTCGYLLPRLHNNIAPTARNTPRQYK